MKIALLAPSGAGKTTFLTGLYGVLTRDLNEDNKYGINFAVTDSKRRGFLEDRYAALIEEDQFGEPSSRLDQYPITLSANSQKLKIELVDFPGGHLHRVGEGEDAQKEVDATVAELSLCDGFIVLLDGEAVIKGSEKGNPRITQNRLKADAAKQILYAALEKRREHIARNNGRTNPDDYAFNSGKTPIVFALTKGDVVEEWLGNEEHVRRLDNSVRGLFHDATLYNSQEGAIGNLIRSQYHQILSMPDVVSLRAAVTVYDQARKTFAPKHLEELLQFVVFAGLNNAVSEYDRRFAEWDRYDTEKYMAANARREALQKAEERRIAQRNQDPISRFLDFLTDTGADYHDNRVTEANRAFTSASSDREVALTTRNRARANRDIAQIFREQILLPTFADALSKGPGKQDFFYQDGLPLKELAKEEWWQKKCKEGQKISSSMHNPTRAPE